jgi:uncharacterized protein
MRLARAGAALALMVLLVAPATAAVDSTIPPAPPDWVTDAAGVLSAPTRQALDRRLNRYSEETGHQVIVWIGALPDGREMEDWSARAFAAWQVGRKGHDDGVAVFLFPNARKVRIEVGYGLEGQLTDLRSGRIIREQIVPQLQQGNWDGAVTGAVDGVLGTLGGEAGAPPTQDQDRAPALGLFHKIVLLVVGLLVLGLLVTHPSMAVWLLYSIFSGGGRGGGGFGGGGFGGGGGGGFSGGGGRSGGGGASGSW